MIKFFVKHKIVIFLVIIVPLAYSALAFLLAKNANIIATHYCGVAVVGESFEDFKNKILQGNGGEGFFDKEKQEQVYVVYATLSFSEAVCRVKVQNGIIVSKDVSKAEGG